MASIRPFRALRPEPSRAMLEHLICDDDATPEAVAARVGQDPRHLGQLLSATAETAPTIAFVVSDLVRAGILKRDGLPSLTVVRSLDGETERTMLYAAVRADDVEGMKDADVDAAAPPVVDVVAAPALFRFVDKKGRIARAIEAEVEREPDASFNRGSASVEVWAVDDESASARIAAMLEGAPLRLDERGRATWAAYRGQAGEAWALGCFVDDDDDGGPIPAGLVLMTLRGPLHLTTQ